MMTPESFALLVVLALTVLVLAGAAVAELEHARERRAIGARIERITRR